MSDAIKAGDLVMVVRDVCCGSGLGIAFTVGRTFRPWQSSFRCPDCRAKWPVNELVSESENFVFPISWLIRIDPPAEGETTEAYKELTA